MSRGFLARGRTGVACRALLSSAVVALAGCGALKPTPVPMPSEFDTTSCAAPTDTLLVMLPGAYSTIDEFVREGIVDAVRKQRLRVDVVRVDAHLGYYNKGTVFERLRQDVIEPARARGYRHIWALGISVGGLGAIAYSDKFPGELEGLVVLAPYLGERLTSIEIANAGGLAKWRVPPRELAMDERLWRRLSAYAQVPTAPDLPPLYLGYGTEDRFAFSHRLLAAALPPDRVATTPGGHDWPEWRRLWLELLPRLPLPRCPG